METAFERPAKGGVLIYGDVAGETGAPERHFILPYNEGRFAKNGVHLVLPKGSIDYDKGEDEFTGSLREAWEETGIDPKRLCCATVAELTEYERAAALAERTGDLSAWRAFEPEAIRRWHQGEAVTAFDSIGYPGVRVKGLNPHRYEHTYHSRANKDQTMVMRGIEVEGIEQLDGYLKNTDGRTTRHYINDDPRRPRFLHYPGRKNGTREYFLEWMQQGYIPESNGLPRVELCDPAWFAEQVKDHAPNGAITTREDWQEFCGALPGKSYSHLRGSFNAIKKHLQAEGWTNGDHGTLKFDEKDCPLHYYVEGAVRKPAVEALSQILGDMRANDDYAKAFGGAGITDETLSSDDKLAFGQVAGFSPFLSDAEWHRAAENAEQANQFIGLRMKVHSVQAAAATRLPAAARGQTR